MNDGRNLQLPMENYKALCNAWLQDLGFKREMKNRHQKTPVLAPEIKERRY
jgi:hypothetical protein